MRREKGLTEDSEQVDMFVDEDEEDIELFCFWRGITSAASEARLATPGIFIAFCYESVKTRERSVVLDYFIPFVVCCC